MAVPRSRAVRRWKRRWQARPSSGENGGGRQGHHLEKTAVAGKVARPEKTAMAGKAARPESYISGTDQENAG